MADIKKIILQRLQHKTVIICVVLISYITSKGEGLQCSTCSSLKSGWACVNNPPEPTDCDIDDKYCVDYAVYDTNGKFKSLLKTCSAALVRPECVKVSLSDIKVKVCPSICSTSGCNWSNSLHDLFNLLKK